MRCWLAIAADAAADADTAAELTWPGGKAAGWLSLWLGPAEPRPGALRVDARLCAPDAEPGWISLVLVPPSRRPTFDDPAIQQARRVVLAGPPAAATSTLLADDSHFAGALTLRRGAGALELLADDPFARVSPARVLRIGAGAVADVPAPPGPTIERHGSDQPWPGGRF